MIEIPIFRFAIQEGLDDTFLPTRGTDKATGWDVKAAENIIIEPSEYAKINLGFRAFCPPGWWLELKPRSSSFVKRNLHALYGVIDEDFEGSMIFACQYNPHLPHSLGNLRISKGEAIGQLIPVKRQEMFVEKISNDEYNLLCATRAGQRGEGGFGSTDGKIK